MANYAHTKQIVSQNIYTNHEGKVTAEMVKTAINEVVDTLIAGGYLYAGIAHPEDPAVSPAPDANVFYIASEAGTYTNKGGLVVADGEVAIFKYNGTWSKEVTGAATAAQVTELGQEVISLNVQTATPVSKNLASSSLLLFIGNHLNIVSGKTYDIFVKSSVHSTVGNIVLTDNENTKISAETSVASDIYDGFYCKITATATASTNGQVRLYSGSGLSAGDYTLYIAEATNTNLINIIQRLDLADKSNLTDIDSIFKQASNTRFSETNIDGTSSYMYIGGGLNIVSGKTYIIYVKSSVNCIAGNVALMDNATNIGQCPDGGYQLSNGYYFRVTANATAVTNGRIRIWRSASTPTIPVGTYDAVIMEISEGIENRLKNIDDAISRINTELANNTNLSSLPLYGLFQDSANVSTSDYIVLPHLGMSINVVAPSGTTIRILGYNLSSSALSGTPTKQSDCVNGDTFEFEGCSVYRVTILNASLNDVRGWISSGTLSLQYAEEDSGIVLRNTHREPIVKAVCSEYTPIPSNPYGNKHIDNLPTFVQVTDIHGDAKRLLNAYEYAKHIGAKYVINTGDTVISNYASGQKFAEEIDAKFSIPTLPTPGNHDVINASNDANIYNSCIAYYATRWGLIADGKPYYYLDDSTLKIRFISLNAYCDAYYNDGGRITQTEFEWLANTLADTPENYGVVLIQHMCCVISSRVTPISADYNSPYFNDWSDGFGGALMELIDAFISKDAKSITVTQHYQYREDEEFTSSVDFTNVNFGVEFICHLCGHSHADHIGYLPSTQRQLSIESTLTNALYGKYNDNTANGTFGEIDNLPRSTKGTTQDSLTVFSIDRINKTLRIAKVGSYITQDMKERNYLIAPYSV